MNYSPLIFLSWFAIANFSCMMRKTDSSLSHDFGKLSPETSVMRWDDTKWEDAKTFLAKSKESYPEDHPAVQRLTYWMRKLHQAALEADPMLGAPQPKILLIKEKTANAHVDYLSVCAPIEINVSDADGQGVARQLYKETQELYQDSEEKCVQREFSEGEKVKVLNLIFEGQADCNNLAIANNSIRVPKKCIDKEGLHKFTKFSSIGYLAASNYIVVHDSLLKNLTEEEVVVILAHELGHYYRLHFFAPRNAYNYFYSLDQKGNPNHKPTPTTDAKVKEMGEKVTEAAFEYLESHKVPQQKFHSLVFNWVYTNYRDLLPRECAEGNISRCPASCVDLRQLFMDKDGILIEAYDFPTEAPWPEGHFDLYASYEKAAEKCLSSIALDASNLDVVKKTVADIPVSLPTLEVSVGTGLLVIANKISELAQPAIDKHNQEIIELVKQANASHLGLYTYEQEADEFSVELATRIGIKEESVYTSYLNLSKNSFNQTKTFPGILTSQECEDAYKKGFPDFVPIADYAGLHHSSCFRVYNAYREFKAHGADLEKVRPKAPLKNDFKEAWKEIQNLLLK